MFKYEMGPLFLPVGSIRSLVVLIILAPLPYMVLKGINIPEFYYAMSTSIIGFLFGQQASNQSNKTSLENAENKIQELEKENAIQKMALMQNGGVIVKPNE